MAETVVNLPPNNLPQERHGGPNARHMVINNTRLIPTGVDLTRTRDRPKNIPVSEKNGVDSWAKRDNGDLAMEENDILDQLRDPNYVEHRSYLLDELYSRVNKYAGQVAIENRQDLFLSLGHALEDYDWEVRQKTVEIIGIVLPHLGDELDHCMDYVLPQVIYNVGDKKAVVRKAAIQTLHLYMQHTSNLPRVFHAVVKYGLEHADRAVNIQATVSLPIFLTSDFASSDIYPIIHSLAVKLCKGQDAELLGATAVTLEAISKKVGQERFNVFIERFPPEIKKLYEVKSKHFKDSDNLDLNSNQKGVIDKSLPQEFARSAIQNEVTNSHSAADLLLSQDNNILRFGIIPQNIMNGLMDQDDWYGRLTAAQALKTLITKLENTSQLKTQFVAFVSFLCQLLEDSNFKVSLVTIEIFQELVLKLNQDIKQYLRPVVSALTKRFGDNKTVIRQANMRVMRKLMQTLEPKPVIDVVSESLRHKKSGVREEALHIIIAALLTFPSNDFDLPKLCDSVAPTLGDPKRKVRQASLETFAVLAQAMGPTKITPLIRAVDGIELQMNDEGVMKAVQARLARRQLPRINAEDTVELPSPLPSSASSRSASSVGFDTVWILKAAGSTGSAKDRSYTDPAIELSQPSPNKSAQNSTFQELTPPKRFHSAGRGKSKLPWEEDRDNRPEVDEDRISDIFDGTSTGRGQLNSAPTQKPQEIKPPFKPRQTWNGSDPNLFESSVRRQRQGFLNDKQDLWEAPAGFGGSYRQQHLDKMRMMSLAPAKNDSEERPYNGSHSAPVSDRDMKPNWTGKNPHSENVLAGSDPFPLPASYLSKKRDERNMEEIWNEKRIVYDTKQKGIRRPKDLSAITKSPRRSFSNSWPDGSFGEDVQPRRNAVSNTPKRAAGHYSGSTAPIPQKATLARSASRSRSKDTSPRDEIIDVDFDDNPLRSPDSDDDLDSADFLQSVRSSAQKKRALKQAKTNKSSSSYQQSYSEPQESAFFNNFTPMNSAVEESGNTIVEASYKSSSAKKGPPDSPFSSKPRIVRSSSGRNPRKHSAEIVSRNIEPPPDFNPAGGVTFRDNPNANVTIVGKGYNKSGEGARGPVIDDTLAAVMNGRQQANARERRRHHKGSVPSPGGVPTVYYQGEPEYGEMISDGSGIRGHGVFGNQQNFHSDQLLTQNKKHGNRRDGGNIQHGDDPPEIVGYSYQQNSPGEHGKSDDEELGMSMSRAVMDKISQKQEKQRKARKAEKVSREMNDDIAERRKKSLEDERQRLKERNELVGLKDSLQRTPERGRKYETQPVRDLEADYQSDSETEKERLVQEREEQFRAEVEQEKRFRLEEERRKASADARKRLQAEEKRRQEEEEYRRLEMEERRIQAEENKRLAEEKRIAEERRLSQEAEMKRRIQEEEDKYAAEEFEEDPSSDYGHVAINNVPKTTQKPPPAITSKRKKIKSPKSPGRHGLSQSVSASSVTTAQDPDTPPSSDATYDQSDELKPLANPSTALKDALRFLEQDDWEVKNDGLTVVRRLSLFHPEVFGVQLHSVVVAVLAEVKNLRSNVSKCAIVCLGDMFVGLNVALDKELDQICKVIMPKALDGSTFIRNSLDNTLMSMIQNVSPQRALAALISVGACHNSKMVRKITAQFLAEIVQRMGPGRVLSGIKDVTDKVLITTAKLSLDAYQETRYYARKIVYMLMQHEDFSRLVDKHVPQKDLKSFQEVVVTLRTKGLAEPSSSESLSAKGSRRSLSNSRANSGSNVHYRDKAYSNGSAHEDRTPPSSVKKSKRSSARSETHQQSVAELVKSLTSSDWKVKIDAVETFQGMCETNPDLVNDNIMKIFDGFGPRLADSNSKVCIVALNTMKEVIPYIADSLPDAVPEVTSKLIKSLASKNNTIYQNSNEIFDLLMDHIDNTLLVQHFAVATKLANARVKPPMIEKLTRLVTTVYPKKPQLIIRQILPVLWDVLGNMTSSGAVPGGSGNLRKATKELVMSLYQFMGRGLMQEASSLSQRSKTALEGLIDS